MLPPAVAGAAGGLPVPPSCGSAVIDYYLGPWSHASDVERQSVCDDVRGAWSVPGDGCAYCLQRRLRAALHRVAFRFTCHASGEHPSLSFPMRRRWWAGCRGCVVCGVCPVLM